MKVPKSAGLPVASLIVSIKNSMNKLAKTNCSVRFDFSVPKNITRVNSPHIKKYAAVEIGSAFAIVPKNVVPGSRIKATSDHQNKP